MAIARLLAGLPAGDKYIEEEEEFKEKYKDHPEFLKDVEELQTSLTIWYFTVFLNLTIEQKEERCRQVLKKLDR